ncbi:uncharacterized protein LOC135943882 [Cloeon dipterum]|uniref:uncharacterized protein LOC135943882 n=1 Tax=Cloeon dipterum TaxID=197152 RepID=UPI00322074DF
MEIETNYFAYCLDTKTKTNYFIVPSTFLKPRPKARHLNPGLAWNTLGQEFWGGVFQSAWRESLEVDLHDGTFLDQKPKTDQDFDHLLSEAEYKECLVLATASSVQELQQYVKTCNIKIPKKYKRLDVSNASGNQQQTHNQTKRVASLGFFECELDGRVTRQNADNVCVLVIHYEFKNDPKFIRNGDTCDVENLKTSFGENRNCNFRNLSPNKETLLQLLGDQDKLLQLFNTQATMANTNKNGSWFVRNICFCLDSADDEPLLKFFTVVQSRMHQKSRNSTNFVENTLLGQTPELKMFTQDRKFIISNTKTTAIPSSNTDATRDTSEVNIKPFSANFPWKSDEEQDIRGRRGFILSVVRSKHVQEMTRVLQNLDFEIREWKLNEQSVKLYTENVSELEPDVGCIMTCIFGPVCENEQKEVCVRVGQETRPITDILYTLVGPKNNKLIGKPKIMFVVDVDVEAPQTDDVSFTPTYTIDDSWTIIFYLDPCAHERFTSLCYKPQWVASIDSKI